MNKKRLGILLLGLLLGAPSAWATWYFSIQLDSAIRSAISLATGLAASVVGILASRVTTRLDREIDRMDELPDHIRGKLVRYLGLQRQILMDATVCAAIGTTLAPASLVVQLASNTAIVSATVLAGIAAASAFVLPLVVIYVVGVSGYIATIDTFHEQITQELGDAKKREKSVGQLDADRSAMQKLTAVR